MAKCFHKEALDFLTSHARGVSTLDNPWINVTVEIFLLAFAPREEAYVKTDQLITEPTYEVNRGVVIQMTNSGSMLAFPYCQDQLSLSNNVKRPIPVLFKHRGNTASLYGTGWIQDYPEGVRADMPKASWQQISVNFSEDDEIALTIYVGWGENSDMQGNYI